MIIDIRKILFLAVASLMITTLPIKECASFPLPSADIKRMVENAKKTYNQVLEIKQEVESNMRIVQEIQNGGYAAAAGDLFAKIQNGDYDRFGANVKGAVQGLKQGAKDAQYAAADKEKRAEIAQKEADKLAKKKKAEDQKAEGEGKEKTEENIEKEKENKFKKAYTWLKESKLGKGTKSTYNFIKNNKTLTSSGLAAIKDAQEGNWGDAVLRAGYGASNISGMDENTSDWISSISTIGGTGYNIGTSGGSALDMLNDAANNSALWDSAGFVNDEYYDYRVEQEEQEEFDAWQEEQRKKQEEEIQKWHEEQMRIAEEESAQDNLDPTKGMTFDF